MNFIRAILDSVVGFVQRNPLLTLLIVVLAVGAPSVLEGIASLILYFFMGFFLLIVVLLLAFRWRIYKVRQQMERQFGFDPHDGPKYGFGGFEEMRSGGHDARREGEVKVHATAATPPKRVSKTVGDYVEFEEEKE